MITGAAFPTYDGFAWPLVLAFFLLGSAATIAFVRRRERWRRPAAALIALVLLSGVLGLFRSIIHACHSLHGGDVDWTPFVASIARGLNTIMMGLLGTIVLTMVYVVGLLRARPRNDAG